MGKALKTIPTKPVKPIKSSDPDTGSVSLKKRKAPRFRPGTVAKREIRRLQKSIDYCLRKAPFQRLCREIGNDLSDTFAMTKGAKDAFQHAAEDYVVNYLKAGYVVAEEGSSSPTETLKPRHTRAANNVALCFPGKPVDYSFAERRALIREMQRAERKHSSQAKTQTKKEKGSKDVDQAQPTSS